MRQRLNLIFALLLGIVFASAAVQPSHAAPMTYEQFLARANALKPGETRVQIIAVLGKPTQEVSAFMDYDLTGLPGFPGLPGPVGTQVFPGGRIELNGGRMVGAIRWDWMDTTGMATPHRP